MHYGNAKQCQQSRANIPDWDIPSRAKRADAHWLERLTQLQTFVIEHGRLPHYKRHTTEHERVLGVWLHTQHQARSESRLLPWHQQHLDNALPNWRSSM